MKLQRKKKTRKKPKTSGTESETKKAQGSKNKRAKTSPVRKKIFMTFLPFKRMSADEIELDDKDEVDDVEDDGRCVIRHNIGKDKQLWHPNMWVITA
jgi:hypothetical protein